MLTEKDFCDYDTCVALKKLGYNEPTLAYYDRFLQSKILLNSVIDKYDMPEDGVNMFDLLTNHNKYKGSKLIDAPTMWEAQKWLREVKKIDVFVRAGHLGKNRVRHYFVEVFTSKDVITLDNDREDFDSYEEAILEGIKEAVKLLKED